MMPYREIINFVFAEPFQPFRVNTASGRAFEVRHPEFAQIGRSTLTVFTPINDDPDAPHKWEKISLMLIESIAPLDAAVAPG